MGAHNPQQGEISREGFMRRVREAQSKEVGFSYHDDANDTYNPCKTLKKQAAYLFYACIDGKWLMIINKEHQRMHDDVEEQCIKKYLLWAKKAGATYVYDRGRNAPKVSNYDNLELTRY